MNHSYYKFSQSFLVDLFIIGFMIKVAEVGRSGQWDIDPVRNTVPPLLVETCLRMVATQIPYNKRSYDTTSDKERTGKSIKKSVFVYRPCNRLGCCKRRKPSSNFFTKEKDV